jgi:hypothetical protein
VDEKSMEWLGAALWLKNHGAGRLVEKCPDLVVPLAKVLTKAIEGTR